jgi:hypothetical protein
MSSQRGRGFAHTPARKCWVKKEKPFSLRRRLARSKAERNKKSFLMPVTGMSVTQRVKRWVGKNQRRKKPPPRSGDTFSNSLKSHSL